MGRRRLVVLVSALLMILIGAAFVTAFVVATQSERGRDLIRRVAQAQLARSVQGTFHIGTLSGSFITDLRIDSLEIRDRDDSLFARSGPIHLTYDPRDLLDGRLIFRTMTVERPDVTMRRNESDEWTSEKLWPRPAGPRRPRARTAFGSMVILERVAVRDGSFALVMPWAPADSLRGVARESAIAEALSSAAHETRRAGDNRFTRTWRWTAIEADVPRLWLVYPDSVGRQFEIARLDVAESDPPFTFKELRGEVRWVADSLWFALPRFTLSSSTGRANGKVWWGNGLPMQYDIHVEGDTVALADVAWISPSLPTSGGGRMTLDIANARGIPDAMEYRISAMDIRSHASRLRGRMTWVVGGPVTILRDVDLEAAPLDFRLIERFSQGPFPYPFAGTINGRMRARGGPLNNFVVDDATLLFRDGNVAGAVATGRARGGIDILDPANAVFRGFTVSLDSFDLRTPQFLNPDFPRLAGQIAGSVRLDSLWLDVRFSEADLTHRDRDYPLSHFRGAGRLTSLETTMAYDVNMVALPISFTTFAQSFPAIPLRGDFSGPLRAQGTLADLLLVTDLSGESGRIEANVRLDAESPGYRMSGRSSITALDPAAAFEDARLPTGELSARLQLDVTGDSLADLVGNGMVAIDRSTLDGVRIFTGESRIRFVDGKMWIDTLHLETTAVELRAAGALGLHAGRSDSLSFSARVDSLGGLRRWLASEASDSLAGGLRVDGLATGWVKDFALEASLDGGDLLLGSSGATVLGGSADLRQLPSKPTGVVSIAADTLLASGFAFNRVFARATLDGSGSAAIDIQAAGRTGTLARAGANVGRSGDTVRVRVDSLVIATGLQRWALLGPSSFINSPFGFAVDSFVLRGSSSAQVRLSGEVPREGELDIRFRTTGLPVADFTELIQVSGVQEGRIDFDARLRGTRLDPLLTLQASVRDGLVMGVRFDTLAAAGTAVADALRFTASLGATARPSVRAEGTIPFSLGLGRGGPTMLASAPVEITIRSDSVSLRMFDALVYPNGDPGNFALDLAVGGTWEKPTFDGGLLVRNGQMTFAPFGDVRWRNVTADIGLKGDSVAIRRLSATTSTAGRDGRASVSGWASIADRANPAFDFTVRANSFNIYNVRNVADVDLSDSLRIDGSLRRPTLRGGLTVDRAIIRIPEVATKDVISLEQFETYGIVDTTLIDQRFLPRRQTEFERNLIVRNVPIRMGRDVWLRSAEANINLGGAISITRGEVMRGRDRGESQLALTGALQTVRGTYRLALGPVQRTFEVEGGEIRWFGDPDLNPALDIAALHTVRQYSKQGAQPDVRVRVNLGGTLLEPTAVLSTPDSARVKNADLISYLVTGGPSFEIAGRNSDYYATTAVSVVISSLGSFLGGKAAGSVCDDARVSTSGLDQSVQGIRNVGSSVLEGARFNCAKQIGERAFVRADAGLCGVGQFASSGNGGGATALANSIGIKLDFLLTPSLTVSGGVEPPTSAVLCSQSLNARGFVPTPKQFGLDLFRAWRF